jgi:hypothetical protein
VAKTAAFDNHVDEYNNWFVINKFAFQSELMAVKKCLPPNRRVIEIGIGSGIFAKLWALQKVLILQSICSKRLNSWG